MKRSAGIIPLALILLSSTFGAGTADAGVFSLFNVVSEKVGLERVPTIQKMKILEVVFSPTLNGQGGIELISDESALISRDSPIIATLAPDISSKDTKTADASSASVSETIDEGSPDVAINYEGEPTIRTYTAKSGDTLSGIAETYNISVNTIVWANNLKRSDPLKIGQQLIILPVSGIQYTVRRGDTLSTIASRYDAEIGDIRDYNNKDDDTLIVGEKIIVPGAELAPVTTTAKKIAQVAKTSVSVVAPATTAPNIAQAQEPAASTSAGQFSDQGQNVQPDSQNQDIAEVPIKLGTLARPKGTIGSSANFICPVSMAKARISQGTHDTWAYDIATPIGTPIIAAEAGTVIVVKPSGYNGGYGLYVAIQHADGVQTLYAHMSKTLAKVGDEVSQGEVIGLVGSTGRSTGPHVHYEVRGAKNNTPSSCTA